MKLLDAIKNLPVSRWFRIVYILLLVLFGAVLSFNLDKALNVSLVFLAITILIAMIKSTLNDDTNPFKVLYQILNIVALIMFLVGLAALGYFFEFKQQPFVGLSIFVAMCWATVFIGYFNWASYFYNVNYGWTDKDWKRYFKALEDKKKGEYVPEDQLKAPKFNPYRSQSFGFPKGTVRGMIALTLLFGALSLLIASFGMDGTVAAESFYWDHFEFFKTAFLMMIAFYFGDKSLRYLNERSNAAREKNYLKYGGPRLGKGDEVAQDDELFSEEAGIQEDEDEAAVVSTETASTVSLHKKVLAGSEKDGPFDGMVPIIDAGHGGLDRNGDYVTAPSKMYEFGTRDDIEQTIYEGVVNREIAKKLITMLDDAGIGYYQQTVDHHKDYKLRERVSFANEVYQKNPKTYFLSIHSNAAGVASPGPGSKAEGFEIFTSKGVTKSDELASIAAKWYKKEFPKFKFRRDTSDNDDDKEADFYVLRYTACPAFLVENLFFDNKKEADFLLSESGQMRIADCLFKIIKEIYETK